jgi:hypothetical protein
VRRLSDAGLAHRDVKPANLLVRDGRMLLIDVAFIEARPTPWRQAVDLANMMLCLALRSNPEQVYRRAQLQFNNEEITEGFAAARGLALPSQLRRMLREKGRDLHAEFVRLLPSPPHPIRIQRWSLRRIGLLALVALLAALVGSNIVQNVTNNEAGATPLYIGNLACSDLEPQWLEAQSVPSASLVPCLRSLPAGWTLSNVTVNNGRSVLTLDNDRAGIGAMVIRLAATCDPAGASQVLSDQRGVRRLMLIHDLAPTFSATRFDVFTGGCVTTQLTAHWRAGPRSPARPRSSSASPPARRSRRLSSSARAGGYASTREGHDDATTIADTAQGRPVQVRRPHRASGFLGGDRRRSPGSSTNGPVWAIVPGAPCGPGRLRGGPS